MESESQALWDTAQYDLRTAEILLEAGQYAASAFHLQQAEEKAMKALLRELGERERTHSGLEIMTRLARLGVEFPADFDTPLRKLDRCFIDTRYPNGGGAPEMLYNRAIVEDLLACCRVVMAFVKSALS